VVAVMVLVTEQKMFHQAELRQTITKQLIVVLMQIVVVEQVDQMVPLPLDQMA
tara:strand:- start:66 stop:224 length:159 start_codon:yes stop_codon:yes gene_type:complete